jgi:phenylpropionate dioxygenase-like ring-hydroxylating dioxygenase large terminal subunit
VHEKHDTELKSQLENIRKKYMLRDLNLVEKLKEQTINRRKRIQDLKSRRHRSNSADSIRSNESKRSSSAESVTKNHQRPSNSRSNSHTDLASSHESLNSKEAVKNNLEKEIKKRSSSALDRAASPTTSILKTSQSPRPPRAPATPTTERKQVKFNAKETHHHLDKETAAVGQQQIAGEGEKRGVYEETPSSRNDEMNLDLNWVMSIMYEDGKESNVHAVRTIEHFDNTLKSIDTKTIDQYEAKIKKFAKQRSVDIAAEDEKAVVIDADDPKKNLEKIEHSIFVFDCKKWLAKDMEDKKIKRNLKLSNVLSVNAK